MSESVNVAEIGQHLEQRFGVNRTLLMGVGLACVLLGCHRDGPAASVVRFTDSVAGRPAAHRSRCEGFPALTWQTLGRSATS